MLPATGLTENTIESNARFFASKADVPTTALTMGLGEIMKSKK
jgi:glucosamine-6-phosphate deaminase